MKYFDIETLQGLQNIFPSKPRYALHPWTVLSYDTNKKFVKPPNTSPLLNKPGIKRVEIIVGSFLYY